MEWMQTVCNFIIMFGGALVAIRTISEWLGKPIRFAKKKSDASFEEKVVDVMNKRLPEILYNHDLQTRDKYKSDREKYLQEIKCEVLQSIQNELSQVECLAHQYEMLVISAKDVLREKIMQIYFKNRQDRVLSNHEKEALEQYYKDYKAIGGNSYIDRYYNRMATWSVLPDEYDD